MLGCLNHFCYSQCKFMHISGKVHNPEYCKPIYFCLVCDIFSWLLKKQIISKIRYLSFTKQGKEDTLMFPKLFTMEKKKQQKIIAVKFKNISHKNQFPFITQQASAFGSVLMPLKSARRCVSPPIISKVRKA